MTSFCYSRLESWFGDKMEMKTSQEKAYLCGC